MPDTAAVTERDSAAPDVGELTPPDHTDGAGAE